MDAREETTGSSRMQQWNKGTRLKGAATSRKEKISGRIFSETVELKVAKQIVGISIRLQKMSEWRLCRGQPPLKQKKRPLITA
jgi:hypothetical protein